ncbi:DNA repair protein Rad52 [Sulfurimonas lithotrophica]|uniref:DNA repair protein Rad52 n=1 Tax=Sulfurimonas lithotrophica TaxID=2590022 RepID=A0A5P8P107_9BACT|nr:Rad52/Rad22 family DNA repair protein [Sulfurimonas lithotrophica]QFR49392.1 DNA repair protein Rad52 [Sulfurimonas lithotrophica]
MFSENQIKALSYNLDDSRVKTIDKAGMSFKYLETYDVINVANNIFNYMWDYTITRLEEVAREVNQNSNHIITYSAIVKVRIYDNQRNFIEREDTGVGIGTAKTIGDAVDNASKSAVSDSLKRCLRSMGAQFGNDLYSKTPFHKQSQNYQQPAQIQQQPYQQTHSQQTVNNAPQDYSSLYNLGLSVVEQGQNLVIIGDDQYNKRDSIKSFGFKFDSNSKTWWKPIQQQAA